ncbi:PREDICTED: exophilin-5 [Nanorana parkeri]|uniref:exophilin-5 n=1 Tax=Nanorana parkeri TaxID=125878 RepID=UPI00085458DC|nr:PREDICTED: exophilin-5 [Nanorana parkeri]
MRCVRGFVQQEPMNKDKDLHTLLHSPCGEYTDLNNVINHKVSLQTTHDCGSTGTASESHTHTEKTVNDKYLFPCSEKLKENIFTIQNRPRPAGVSSPQAVSVTLQNIWSNSKLGTSKRDVKWLHAVSGEWFEEIQKKKFRDDQDVRNLVRTPLTHRLKKKTPKGDLESSRMSSSRTYQSPKSSNTGPSFLKIRSPFASLFSFRKSKHEVKLPAQEERQHTPSFLETFLSHVWSYEFSSCGYLESSRMSSSRTYQSPKSSNTGPSFLKIRSPFASLFSFRKSKHEVKLPAQEERYNIFSTLNRPPPSTEPVKKKFEIYHSGRSVKQIASFFEGHQKKTNQNIPSDVQLQREAFQVLGDLDQKLAQEQSCSHPPRNKISSTYQHGNVNSKESSCRNPSDTRKEYSTLSSRDERRTVSLEEAHSTHATYQPRRFNEIYSVTHHSESKTEACSKDIYARSLCSDLGSKSPSIAPISGKFSSSSLHLPSESLEHERSRQLKPRRIPITSIRWNKSASSQPEVSGRPFRTQSALDLTYAGNTSQQNRIFDLYKYGNSNKVSPSGSNDFHKVNYQNNLTCTTYQNSSNKCSTGYYKTDSCGLKSITKFPTQTNCHWEEENKENSLKLNKVTSQPPSYAGTKSEKNTEHMEVLNEYPSQDNICNIMDQTEDCIFTGNKSDPHDLNLQTKNISAKSDISGVDMGVAILQIFRKGN